jgi:hypothetical protein
MKLFAIAVLAFALGLVVGLRIGNHFLIGALRSQFASSSAQHQMLALASLHTLNDLQAGHVDLAKSFLARQIAYYYNGVQQFDPPSPDKRNLLSHIEATSLNSPELKDALSKKRQ